MKSAFRLLCLAAIASAVGAQAAPTGRYKVIVDKLNQLHEQYSGFSEILSIGTNDDGEEIVAMRVSTSPAHVDPNKIGQLVVSTHHGNELKAPEFTMYWLEELLKKYTSDELFRGNYADREWTVIPVLNISGYNAANRYEKGQDPNRDYPGPCISGVGGRLKSIESMMEFLTSRTFAGSLTVHGYAGALTYPWGVNVANTHTKDHTAYDTNVRGAAALNGYRYGTSTDIVYPCDGAFEDYVYWKHGIWSLLLELQSGSQSDIVATSSSIFHYFDHLDSSPSVNNQLESHCSRAGTLDRHDE